MWFSLFDLPDDEAAVGKDRLIHRDIHEEGALLRQLEPAYLHDDIEHRQRIIESHSACVIDKDLPGRRANNHRKRPLPLSICEWRHDEEPGMEARELVYGDVIEEAHQGFIVRSFVLDDLVADDDRDTGRSAPRFIQ